MSYEFLDISVSDGVAIVTINRPEVLNGLHPESHHEMEQVWGDLGENDEVRAAILTGAGRAFCAGGDLKDMESRLKADPSGGSGISPASARRIVYNLLDFEKPLIGAINGHAIGLGATLGLLCDIVVSSENAKWGDPHINIGLVPGDGGLAIWTVLIGPNKAKEMMMLGAPIDAKRADQLGLINYLVPEEDVLDKALAIASSLSEGPQVALRGTKISINNWLKSQFSSLFEVSLAAELQSMDHPDYAEGVQAALEKRNPNWQ
ncbi:MAG: enoyl-CoA hydratase/isomerase family protein [Acidimicrobiales bacterium]|nr:enoyl-CoA hydratase/isomerase family protein [Acidimicrobiales bacterium]